MTCYLPLPYFVRGFTKTGKNDMVVLSRTIANLAKYSLRVPCGQCVGCRLDYSRQWAIRCMHESQLYDDNCFITLTYNDEFLPANKSLNYDHWVKFMKRLRRHHKGSNMVINDEGLETYPIRFYMGPEYGDKSGRPHYHALLFNFDFPDKELFTIRNECRLYTSALLNSLWSCPKSGRSYGFASVGSVTFESAAYVARYMMKKVKGDDNVLRYFTDVDPETGEIVPIAPEKARMSRMPGLATGWFDCFYQDVYPSDEVVLSGGRKSMPPKFYDKLFEAMNPEAYEDIKVLRLDAAYKNKWNNSQERLEVRRVCKEKSIESLVRNIDL